MILLENKLKRDLNSSPGFLRVWTVVCERVCGMMQFIVEFYNATYYERYDELVSEGTLTVLWSLTTAIFIPGGMIGSFLGGWLADKIGR